MEPEGRSGGLALFYMDSYDVSILYFDKRMIDIAATIEGHRFYMTLSMVIRSLSPETMYGKG